MKFMTDEIDPTEMNEAYQEHRRALQRLRSRVHDTAFDRVARFPLGKIARMLRTYNERVDGDLVVFVANDFGMPVAYRPTGVPKQRQNEIRTELLAEKYKSDDRLDEIRKQLTTETKVHKALVGAIGDEEIRYHLPGVGSVGNEVVDRDDPEAATSATNFLTVREGVGLVDFCTNADQQNCIEY